MLGLLLFAAQNVFRRAEPRVERIEATPEVIAQLRHDFRERFRREPNAEELAQLGEEWIDREVLFREGIKLGLDEGDPVVRNRVAQRMRGVLEKLVPVPEPSAADLEEWVSSNANRYRTLRRFSFSHVHAAGARGRERAAAFARALAAGTDSEKLGDEFEFGNRFDARGEHGVRKIFGDAFIAGLSAAPREKWTIIESKRGWHAVRLASVTGGEPDRERMRSVAIRDWKNQQRARLVKARVDELERQYLVQ
jgi:hypothetical protein